MLIAYPLYPTAIVTLATVVASSLDPTTTTSTAPPTLQTMTGHSNPSQAQVGQNGPLVWIDSEMTGLNPDSDEILEVFCFITTANLEIIDPTGFGAVVHVPTERLDQMDDWCTNTHTATGLWDQVVASTTTAEEAAASLLAYIQKWVPEPNTALLAGNSVHADRAFLRKGPWAPVVEYLKYRIMDVSTIKEAALRWSPPGVSQNAPQKTGLHRAKEDILDSIREAKYYKDVIFSRGE